MLVVAVCSGELSVPLVSIDLQVHTSPHLLNEVEGKAVGAPYWVPVLLPKPRRPLQHPYPGLQCETGLYLLVLLLGMLSFIWENVTMCMTSFHSSLSCQLFPGSGITWVCVRLDFIGKLCVGTYIGLYDFP